MAASRSSDDRRTSFLMRSSPFMPRPPKIRSGPPPASPLHREGQAVELRMAPPLLLTVYRLHIRGLLCRISEPLCEEWQARYRASHAGPRRVAMRRVQPTYMRTKSRGLYATGDLRARECLRHPERTGDRPPGPPGHRCSGGSRALHRGGTPTEAQGGSPRMSTPSVPLCPGVSHPL